MSERPSFLGDAPENDETAKLFDADRDEDGYVANHTRLWSWRPDLRGRFADLRTDLMASSSLTDRDWAVLVTSTAAELTDSYCSLAWGERLAKLAGDETAAQVLLGNATGLTEREAALSGWARQLVRDPNGTTEADVDRLREVGLNDREIFEATTFIAFRLAFSTVNDALGAVPDKQVADAAPGQVRAAVTYGRPPASVPSQPAYSNVEP